MKKLLLVFVMCLMLAACSAPEQAPVSEPDAALTAEIEQLRSENERLSASLEEAQTKIADLEKASAQVEQPTQQSQSQDATVALGDIVQLGGFDICMSSVEFRDKILDTFGSFAPDDGSKFLVISGSVENRAKEPKTFMQDYSIATDNIDAYVLFDGEYKFTLSYFLAFDGALNNSRLNPLSKKEGILACQVPQSVVDSDGPLELIFVSDSQVSYKLR